MLKENDNKGLNYSCLLEECKVRHKDLDFEGTAVLEQLAEVDLIDDFFEFIEADTHGKRLIAKIKNSGNAFNYTEKLGDFSKLYIQYTIKNRSNLNAFFLQETKGNMSQLFDDFERNVIQPVYKLEQEREFLIAAEPPK